jgi:nitrous oxidase accessory protein NosD
LLCLGLAVAAPARSTSTRTVVADRAVTGTLVAPGRLVLRAPHVLVVRGTVRAASVELVAPRVVLRGARIHAGGAVVVRGRSVSIDAASSLSGGAPCSSSPGEMRVSMAA